MTIYSLGDAVRGQNARDRQAKIQSSSDEEIAEPAVGTDTIIN
jgi:hypothetical protein